MGKHFHSDGVCEVCHRKYDDRFFIADLSCIKIDDLPMEGDLSHLCDNLVKRDRFIVKIPAVDQVRIVSGLDRAIEIFLLKPALSKAFPALLSAP